MPKSTKPCTTFDWNRCGIVAQEIAESHLTDLIQCGDALRSLRWGRDKGGVKFAVAAVVGSALVKDPVRPAARRRHVTPTLRFETLVG